MNYAVLHAPEFRLQAASRHRRPPAGQARALLETLGGKTKVAEACAHARQQGVHPGMSPAQALARCASLHFIQADSARENDLQDLLLQSATTLSPWVESTAPGRITIALPPEKTFTENILFQSLAHPLQSLDLHVRIGLAPTPDLAFLAARQTGPDRTVFIPENFPAFLAPLPLSLLDPSPDLSAILKSWGISTLGALLALPIGDLGSKLGPEALALREKLSPKNTRPLQVPPPVEKFVERMELEHAIETLEPLLFLLRRFLDQLAKRLALLWLVAGKLQLTLFFENKTVYRRLFVLPQPTLEIDLLFRMLHTHLENFTSEAVVIGLELEAWSSRPTADQFDLFQQGFRDPHQFAETLARLQALLRADRIGIPHPENSHRPDQVRLLPCVEKPEAVSVPLPGIFHGLPLLRFRPPLPARVRLEDNRPAFLQSVRLNGPLRDLRGPWKLSGHWWDKENWMQEEWDAALPDGSLCRLSRSGQSWKVEGIYA